MPAAVACSAAAGSWAGTARPGAASSAFDACCDCRAALRWRRGWPATSAAKSACRTCGTCFLGSSKRSRATTRRAMQTASKDATRSAGVSPRCGSGPGWTSLRTSLQATRQSAHVVGVKHHSPRSTSGALASGPTDDHAPRPPCPRPPRCRHSTLPCPDPGAQARWPAAALPRHDALAHLLLSSPPAPGGVARPRQVISGERGREVLHGSHNACRLWIHERAPSFAVGTSHFVQQRAPDFAVQKRKTFTDDGSHRCRVCSAGSAGHARAAQGGAESRRAARTSLLAHPHDSEPVLCSASMSEQGRRATRLEAAWIRHAAGP